MKKSVRISILLFLCSLLLLAACNGSEGNLTNGDKAMTEDMHEVISDYIVSEKKHSYYPTEKQFEVHKVYGTSEENDVMTVYMWSYYAGFDKATGLEDQAGQSLPAVISISTKDGNYEVVDYTEAGDGEMYLASLNEMFPKKYVKYAKEQKGREQLKSDMSEKVEKWLEEQEK